MSQEQKSEIRKKIFYGVLAMAALLVVYIVFGLITKNINIMVFNVLVIAFVIVYIVLTDILDPILTKTFEEMDDYRRDAYRKYLLFDTISMLGLLYFVLTFSSNSNTTYEVIALLVYFFCNKKKQPFRAIYLGELTRDDIEAAKGTEEEMIDGEATVIEEEKDDREGQV